VYPVFSRSYSMRTGKDRVQVDAEQVPVTIGQARVCPGDMLRGDTDGVVVIPRARENEVLTIAEEIDLAEQAIRERIEAGASLAQAREELRYHQLQSRKPPGPT
jgi:4-hydroxy-4-methyl-2-oxoglutarate aldolase